MGTQGKPGQKARMMKASLPEALAAAGLGDTALAEAAAEVYTTGSRATAVSDLTLEQAI